MGFVDGHSERLAELVANLQRGIEIHVVEIDLGATRNESVVELHRDVEGTTHLLEEGASVSLEVEVLSSSSGIEFDLARFRDELQGSGRQLTRGEIVDALQREIVCGVELKRGSKVVQRLFAFVLREVLVPLLNVAVHELL